MKNKFYGALLYLTAGFHSFPGTAFPHGCVVPCYNNNMPGINCGATVETYDHAQDITFNGEELPTEIAQPDGDDLFFSGPAKSGGISNGPYFDKKGRKVIIHPTFTISTDWRPDTGQRCNHRNLLGACNAWDTFNRETGFTIDYALIDPDNNERFVIYSEVFKNMNNENQRKYPLPRLECNHSIKSFEVRIHDVYGGSVDFRIHSLKLNVQWNN